jgi:pteridine reductase
LVTGSAHRLGSAIAARLAAAGRDIVVHYGRSASAAETTASLIRDVHGVRAWTLQADLTDPSAIDSLFETVAETCGRLDVLVNSAASFSAAPLSEVDADAWDRIQAINVRAPHLCIRRARSLLEAAAADGGTAAVINVADLSGVVPWRNFGAHGVSKAGLLHLTRCAALEMAPQVRVNAVVPGAILPPPGETTESTAWRAIGERLPLGRPGSPEDVGDAVAFLAGARFVTGEVLFVDGGEHLFGSTKR